MRRLQSSAAKLATALAAARITISTSSRLARQESRPEQGERERDLRGPRASLSVDGSSNTRAGGRALGCRDYRPPQLAHILERNRDTGDAYRKVDIMIRNGALVAIVLCALVYSPVLPAQNASAAPTTGGTESTTQRCFRGHPRPQCDVFWLTEFGVAAPISSNPNQASQGALFTWELGGMVNRSTRQAFGVAAFTQAILWGSDQTGQGAAVGIRPRVRFWMSHTTSFDIAPGMVVLGSGAPGFSGHAGLNIADYVGLTMHVVALRPERFDVDRSTRVAVFAGGRLASVPGTIVGVGGPAAVLVAFLIVCGSGSCFGN